MFLCVWGLDADVLSRIIRIKTKQENKFALP